MSCARGTRFAQDRPSRAASGGDACRNGTARDESVNPIPAEADRAERPRFVDRRVALIALLALASAAFALIALRPLTHSEVRYVEAGAEMVASGDWIVPHLSFVPYFEKPILTYWVEAAAQLLFGLSPIAVRLPSILAAVGMVAATYAIGRSMRGAAFGLGAASLLTASAMFLVMGSVVTTDPFFSVFLALAWCAFWRHDRAPQSPWIWAFWAALGLAVLTKGPLGVALVGSTVGAYLLLSGRLADVLAMRPVRGVAMILAINLPWSIAVWRRDPRFLEFFYVRENLRALTDSSINHAGPPWYYLPILVLAFFPFSLLVAWAVGTESWSALAGPVRSLLRRAPAPVRPDPGRLYLACMLVPPFLLLSVSASKLATYVVPLFPAVALVVASHVADRLRSPTGVLRWSMLVQVALLAVAAAGACLLADRIPAERVALLRGHAETLGLAAAALMLPMAAGGELMARRRIVAGMAIVAAGSLAGVVLVSSAADELAGDRDAGSLVQQLIGVRKAGERVVIAGPVVDDYTIVLALRERPYVWGLARELGMGHFAEVTPPGRAIPDEPYEVSAETLPENRWLLGVDELKSAWNGPERVWFVGRPRDLEKLREEGLHVHVLARTDSRAVATNHSLTAEH
jgi:4-amino-4-deoxy-L-arabinose transferase-like glycosyltransferase